MKLIFFEIVTIMEPLFLVGVGMVLYNIASYIKDFYIMKKSEKSK